MLPSKEKATIESIEYPSPIAIYRDKAFKAIDIAYRMSQSEYQHLYLFSYDRVAKSGEWAINRNLDTIYQINNGNCLDWFTILATTDMSIAIEHDTLSIPQRRGLTNHYPTQKQILPQPSKEFIEAYIESYNKGSVIKDVMVLYEYE